MPIDLRAAALPRAYSRHYAERTWLAAELPQMLARGAWVELGGLFVHIALAVSPIGGLAERLSAARELAPLSSGDPVWTDPAWAASELGQHIAAVLNPASDLQAAALRAAGVVARLEIA